MPMPIGVSQAFHVNVNCSDLERSLAFYRDLLGLTASTRTKPEAPQDGAGHQTGPQETWWALEDLWSRLAMCCPVSVERDGDILR